MPLVHINDPDSMPELIAALRDGGCVAKRVGGSTCLVTLPFGDDEGFPTELAFFLRAWTIERRSVQAELVA